MGKPEVVEWTQEAENAKDVSQIKIYNKALEMLGEEKEIHIMKGLATNILKATKEGTNEPYYMIDLKVLKKFGNDSEYGQSYNLYNVLVPTILYKTDDDMRELKGNEVVCICSTRCSVRNGKNEGTKFNSISFFAISLELARVVNNVTSIVNHGRTKL